MHDPAAVWAEHPETVAFLERLRARLRDCERRGMSCQSYEELIRVQSEYATLYGIIKLVENNKKENHDA